MNKIAIISGSGFLPLAIGKDLIKKDFEVIFFYLNKFADETKYKNFHSIPIDINSFSKIIKLLKENKIDEIILAGGVIRPSIKDIKFDIYTMSLIKNFLLESKGDDNLLKSIENVFLKNGFPLFDWKKECTDLFTIDSNLITKKPSKNAILNKNKGLEVFKFTGRADIGQSLIIQNQLILGVECIEGTNELIKRTSAYKKEGDKGILVKLSKYNQHNKLDIPTIGIETLKLLKKYNFEGIFVEKNNCIILDKKLIIEFCNDNNLFLNTVDKFV
jgi:DUF1009 family protein